MATALWWVRRDLRLADNQALARALCEADRVVPVFVLDPALLAGAPTADRRVAFLFGGLAALDAGLRDRGSRLVLRRGRPERVLPELRRETGAHVVVAEEDATPYAVRRDRAVGEAVPLALAPGLTAQPIGAIRKADGGPYQVFTPFRDAWRGRRPPDVADLIDAPAALPGVPDVASEPLPARPDTGAGAPFPPGEAEASRRLAAFVRQGDRPGVFDYAEARDRLDLDGTSLLSPYLRFGMVSARAAVVAARGALEAADDEQGRRGAQTWLDELVWREFFISVLHEFPEVYGKAFRASLREIAWRDDPEALAAWREGRTGYPVVDASMRQLAATGWMHNRGRMIVASFLAKDLLLDWRLGEAHFMGALVDGDPAANNGGWQWAAGTGTDAAPYFRVFNPTTQGRKHDPDGAFVRRWVPELRGVPERRLHSPWEMTTREQSRAGCVLGADYPWPIVDHGRARERALAAYRRSRANT